MTIRYRLLRKKLFLVKPRQAFAVCLMMTKIVINSKIRKHRLQAIMSAHAYMDSGSLLLLAGVNCRCTAITVFVFNYRSMIKPFPSFLLHRIHTPGTRRFIY